MKHNRREILKSGSMALLGGGLFSRMDKVAAMQQSAPTPNFTAALKSQGSGPSQSLLLGPTPGEEGPPQPTTADRLPLEWNKQTDAHASKTSSKRGAWKPF